MNDFDRILAQDGFRALPQVRIFWPIVNSSRRMTKSERTAFVAQQLFERAGEPLIVDLTNLLATAARRRDFERTAALGYMIAAEANFVPLTAKRMAGYLDAFNSANEACYEVLRALGLHTGRTPRMQFDPARRCDPRCYHAVGAECVCMCGGIGHGVGYDWTAFASGQVRLPAPPAIC